MKINSKDNPELFCQYILQLIRKQMEENPVSEETVREFFRRIPKFHFVDGELRRGEKK